MENNTQITTILDLLDEQVKRQPEKIIVECNDKRFTYREMDLAAQKVCSYLRRRWTEGNLFVGVIGKRSEQMLIVMWGILKAGMAYIPLDSEFPENRIRYMCKDSGVRTVIAISPMELDLGGDIEVINVENIQKECVINAGQQVFCGDELAYMIYTSGSSGMPKGVMVTHSNLVYFVNGIEKEIHFGADTVIACITTMSFDFFFIESFLPLILGLKIVIFNEECQKDPLIFSLGIKTHQVNAVLLTPSRLRLLLQYDEFYECLSGMHELMVGGEQFPVSLFEKLVGKTKARIWNVYGPTEATIAVSVKEIQGSEITIGHPFENVRYYILDGTGNHVKGNEIGELYIAGPLVSKGYLNRTELTAKSFLPDIINPNEIMYKTGDLVKYAANGEFIILGRTDDQVKVRGYRIELGEVEDTIMRYTEVEQAVTKVVENHVGIQQLCCFYKAGEAISEFETKSILEKYLPDYMIPDIFIRLEKFYYTLNGKIDRKRLEVPEIHKEEDKVNKENILDTIQEIWGSLTMRSTVDVDRPLLEMGGNSVLLVEFCVRLNKIYPVNLNIMQLFRMSKLSKIAEHISGELLDD